MLWLYYTKFRSWAKFTYHNNKVRAAYMRDNPIRFSVCCPDGRVLQVKLSILCTGGQLKTHVGQRIKQKLAGKRNMALLFEGVPVNDKMTLHEAGVRPRSTVVLTRRPHPVLVDLPGDNPNCVF